jgi:D-lactate dehydrogenase
VFTFPYFSPSSKVCTSVNQIGVGSTLAELWTLKSTFEGLPIPYASEMPELAMYYANGFFPNPLPPRVRETAGSHEHHLIVVLEDFNGSSERVRARVNAFLAERPGQCDVYACETPGEIAAVRTFRFAAAPAFRTYCLGKGLHAHSFDFTLPKNYGGNVALEPAGASELAVKMMYAHYGCHVFHYDVATTGEAAELKPRMVEAVEALGGRLPAEHGHGTEYHAPKETVERWKKMDPLNLLNPGVGKAPEGPRWT